MRGGRRFEYSVRESLGDVAYRAGDLALSHEAYVRGVAGRPNAHRYPGFSSDTSVAFEHLLADLASYGGVFLAGADEELQAVAQRAAMLAPPRGFRALT